MSSDEDSFRQSHEKFTVERSSSNLQPPEDSCSCFGPVLPPHLLKSEDSKNLNVRKVYGPTTPEIISSHELELCKNVSSRTIGPEIPEHLKLCPSKIDDLDQLAASDEDEDSFGPSAVLMTKGEAMTCKSISTRNLNKESPKESNSKRETWMTELPIKKGVNLGLLPRHFKSRVLTDKESDSSVWTDTPSEKNKTDNQNKIKDHRDVLTRKRLEKRDKEMEKLVRKAAKKMRKRESLLEMHLKSMKKKKKKEAKKNEKGNKSAPERRPFDRDVDLQIHRIDERQKRAILNKSLSLNDRFSSGQSKFL